MGEGVIEEHRLEELLVEKLDKISSSLEVKMGTHNLPDEHTKWGRTILPDEHTKWGRTILPDEHTEWGRTICQTNTQYFGTFGALYIDLKLFPWCFFFLFFLPE